MEFSLTSKEIETLWIASNGRCSVTGLPFNYDNVRGRGATKNPFAPSLDRIESKRGYTIDNVRFVLTAVNIGMMDWGLPLYLHIAGAAIAHLAANNGSRLIWQDKEKSPNP